MNALAEKDMQRQRQGVANQPPQSSLASYHPENQACRFPSGSVKVQHNQAKPITAMTQLLDSLGWSLGNTETNALAGGQEGAAAQRGDTIGIEANVLAGASTADMSVSERLAVIPSGSDLVQLLHAAVGMPEPARSSQDLLPRVPHEG